MCFLSLNYLFVSFDDSSSSILTTITQLCISQSAVSRHKKENRIAKKSISIVEKLIKSCIWLKVKLKIINVLPHTALLKAAIVAAASGHYLLVLFYLNSFSLLFTHFVDGIYCERVEFFVNKSPLRKSKMRK